MTLILMVRGEGPNPLSPFTFLTEKDGIKMYSADDKSITSGLLNKIKAVKRNCMVINGTQHYSSMTVFNKDGYIMGSYGMPI